MSAVVFLTTKIEDVRIPPIIPTIKNNGDAETRVSRKRPRSDRPINGTVMRYPRCHANPSNSHNGLVVFFMNNGLCITSFFYSVKTDFLDLSHFKALKYDLWRWKLPVLPNEYNIWFVRVYLLFLVLLCSFLEGDI